MANNRLVLICTICNPSEDWDYGVNTCVMAKYYPSTGYYTDKGKLNAFSVFLEHHLHPGEDYPFRLEYEVPPKPSQYMK